MVKGPYIWFTIKVYIGFTIKAYRWVTIKGAQVWITIKGAAYREHK